MTIMTGQVPKYPLLISDDEEDMELEDEVDRSMKLQKIHHEIEVERLVKKCMGTRIPGYKHEKLEKGDDVLVQDKESKKWDGPYNVVDDRGSMVDVEMKGAIREINRKGYQSFMNGKIRRRRKMK